MVALFKKAEVRFCYLCDTCDKLLLNLPEPRSKLTSTHQGSNARETAYWQPII